MPASATSATSAPEVRAKCDVTIPTPSTSDSSPVYNRLKHAYVRHVGAKVRAKRDATIPTPSTPSTSDFPPAPAPRPPYNVAVDAPDVPVAFVNVTVTEVIPLTFPETVNGIVKLNWLPY